MIQNDEANMKWMEVNTKPCPKCAKPLEKVLYLAPPLRFGIFHEMKTKTYFYFSLRMEAATT